MFFSELYSAYYNTVAKIITKSLSENITSEIIRNICEENAFKDSSFSIEPKIIPERKRKSKYYSAESKDENSLWMITKPDGSKFLQKKPTLPLTTLEKQWLNAIYSDPRIRLFTDDIPLIPDVEPLFTPDEIVYFDMYNNGDDYNDVNYIKNFRMILNTLKQNDTQKIKTPLEITTRTSNDRIETKIIIPEYLEYSEKDDKFRLIGTETSKKSTINLGRITDCKLYDGAFEQAEHVEEEEKCILKLELIDEKNALERILLHFANFEKKVIRIDTKHYSVSVTYDKSDESEMVIRVLSFGPHIKATAPDSLVTSIRERIEKQIIR